MSSTAAFSFVEPSIDESKFELSDTKGYEPMEYLKGYLDPQQSQSKTYQIGDKIALKRPGIFGQC